MKAQRARDVWNGLAKAQFSLNEKNKELLGEALPDKYFADSLEDKYKEWNLKRKKLGDAYKAYSREEDWRYLANSAEKVYDKVGKLTMHTGGFVTAVAEGNVGGAIVNGGHVVNDGLTLVLQATNVIKERDVDKTAFGLLYQHMKDEPVKYKKYKGVMPWIRRKLGGKFGISKNEQSYEQSLAKDLGKV